MLYNIGRVQSRALLELILLEQGRSAIINNVSGTSGLRYPRIFLSPYPVNSSSFATFISNSAKAFSIGSSEVMSTPASLNRSIA